MSNTNEKMNKLREKLLDAALAANTEDARILAETIAMMPPEDPILKVGVAEPKAGDDEALAKCVKLLAQQGWVVLGPESAGETLHRMKKEGLDLFMGQGLPSFGETLAALKSCRPIGAGALLRAMGFPDLARVATESFPCAGSAKVDSPTDHASQQDMAGFVASRPIEEVKLFTKKFDKSPFDASRSELKNWIQMGLLSEEFRTWKRDKSLARHTHTVAIGHALHEFRWTEPAVLSKAPPRLPAFVSPESLRAFACARDGLAFKTTMGQSPESASTADHVAWINDQNLYIAFAEWERLSRSKVSDPAKSSEEKTYWFVPNAPMVLTTGTHLVYGEGGDFETKSAIGGASASRSPIPLRAKSGPFWTKGGKVCLYQRTAESAPGHVFDDIVSARASMEPEKAPKPSPNFLTPAEAQSLGQPSYRGARYTVEPVAWLVLDERGGETMVAAAGSPVWSDGGARTFQTTTEVEFGGSVVRRPYPLTICGLDGVPAISDAGECVRLSGFSGSVTGKVYRTEAVALASLEKPVATHWFVPVAPFKANGDGLGVTSPDGATQFYTIASGRKVDRSPVPLRLKSGIVPPVIFGTWRLYRPGSSVAGAIFETLEEAMEHAALSEAPAPKKARYGMLDASISGPSALTIVETVDGIPVAITVRDFAPGPLLGTMLRVAAMCFKHGVTDLYGDSFREHEIRHAFDTIATFMRGEALHGISEADRASFLRMATTIEWPRAYTIPTFKALPALF